MKKFMLLMSAALVLASCSQDEMKEEANGRAIDFRAQTASRATETTTANITSFYASAFLSDGGAAHFENVEFKKTESVFQSDTKYYWPSEGQELTFAAWSPAQTAIGGTWNVARDAQTIAGFSPANNVADQVDFIYTTATGSKTNNEKDGVALTFNHALSQIQVMAKNVGDVIYKVAGVKIAAVTSQADFSFASGWTLDNSQKTTYKVVYADAVTLGADAANIMGPDAGNAMLLPQQLTGWDINEAENTSKGAYIAVKINAKDKDGNLLFPKSDKAEAYGWVAVPIDTKWEAGKKYIYTLDFSTGSGVVAPAAPNDTDPGVGGGETTDDEKNPGGDKPGEDKPEPGKPALGKPIQFTVTVTPWTDAPQTPNMNL